MVELRKRPAAAAPAPPPTKKRAPSKSKVEPSKEEPSKEEPEEVAPAVEEKPIEAAPVEAPKKGAAPKAGDSIALEGFGGEIQTNEEEKTTLAKLVADSKAGVVLFTYPKASTPGCENAFHTTQRIEYN